MEEKEVYLVEITPEAEYHFLQFLDYLYENHSSVNADTKSEEILKLTSSLEYLPCRGRAEL